VLFISSSQLLRFIVHYTLYTCVYILPISCLFVFSILGSMRCLRINNLGNTVISSFNHTFGEFLPRNRKLRYLFALHEVKVNYNIYVYINLDLFLALTNRRINITLCKLQ